MGNNVKIEVGDFVKLNKPIKQLDAEGNATKYEFGIVVYNLRDSFPKKICVVIYTAKGEILLRKYRNYFIPARYDLNIDEVTLFLKGSEPDGSIIE